MTEPVTPPPLIQNISSTSLSACRMQIDTIDSQLLQLLNQRVLIVQQIGKLKKKEGIPVYSPSREEQLLRRLVEQNKGPLSAETIRAVYREILSASRAVEKEIVIACLAPVGGVTYQAAHYRFGSNVKYVFFKEAADILKRISQHEVDYGVIPIETAQQGLEGDSLDALAKTDLHAYADITLGNPEDGSITGWFLVLGRTLNPPSGFDRTLIILRVEDKPGALIEALEPFKKNSNNLFHLVTRPTSQGSKDIFFFVEAEGHSNEWHANGFLRDLSQRCRAVKVLGSYPKT